MAVSSSPFRQVEPEEFDVEQLLCDVCAYVRYVADAFRLKDWHFEVEVGTDLADSLATIRFTPRRRIGLIRVGDGFLDASEDDQRHGICHELAHAHLEAVRDTVNTVRGSLGLGAWEVLKANLDDQIESVADEWARVGAMHLMTFRGFCAHRDEVLAAAAASIPQLAAARTATRLSSKRADGRRQEAQAQAEIKAARRSR